MLVLTQRVPENAFRSPAAICAGLGPGWPCGLRTGRAAVHPAGRVGILTGAEDDTPDACAGDAPHCRCSAMTARYWLRLLIKSTFFSHEADVRVTGAT